VNFANTDLALASRQLRHDVELSNDPRYLLLVFYKVKSNVVLVYRILPLLSE